MSRAFVRASVQHSAYSLALLRCTAGRMLEKRRELAKMAATARAERQRLGFVDAEEVTDEELIFQQFIDDASDEEHDDDGSSDSDDDLDVRARARCEASSPISVATTHIHETRCLYDLT